MLVYKAQQIVACVKDEPKPWSFDGKSGVSHSARLSCFGVDGSVASIRLKAKTAEELVLKVSKYTLGKSAEVPINEVTPVFKTGERRAASYEYVG